MQEKIRLISAGSIGWENNEEWDPTHTLSFGKTYEVVGIRQSQDCYPLDPGDVVDMINNEGNIRGYHVDHFRRVLMSNEERVALRKKELKGVL